MTDIVERLNDSLSAGYSELRKEAAVEIMRLRVKIEAMEKQEPVAAQQRFQRQQEMMAVWLPWQTTALRKGRPARTVDALGLNVEYRELYLAPGAQPAPSVPECPYPCGWRNLLNYAIEDGAYLARSINEDEPVTENARAVTMRTVMRLRDVLMTINKAAPEAKP